MVPIPFLTPHAEKEDSFKVEQKCHFFCLQKHFIQVAAHSYNSEFHIWGPGSRCNGIFYCPISHRAWGIRKRAGKMEFFIWRKKFLPSRFPSVLISCANLGNGTGPRFRNATVCLRISWRHRVGMGALKALLAENSQISWPLRASLATLTKRPWFQMEILYDCCGLGTAP